MITLIVVVMVVEMILMIMMMMIMITGPRGDGPGLIIPIPSRQRLNPLLCGPGKDNMLVLTPITVAMVVVTMIMMMIMIMGPSGDSPDLIRVPHRQHLNPLQCGPVSE